MKQYMLCALAAAVIANTAAPVQYVYADDTFETGDKIVGDVEIGDFDLPEEPEISVEPAPDITIDAGKDETTPITPEEPEITVDVDMTDLGRGMLMFDIGYTVRSTNNPNNLVFPYYLYEGVGDEL